MIFRVADDRLSTANRPRPRLIRLIETDYSDQPFNLFGFICLKNCLAFGVASVPGVYWGFPLVNNLINWLDKHWRQVLNVGTVGLFTVYMAIQAMVMSGHPPAKVFHLSRPYFDIAGVCKNQPTCPPPRK